MNFALFGSASAVIQLHIVAAIGGLALGAYVLSMPKGTWAHRAAGRSFAVALLVTAISSFWITGGDGAYSWIHGLSVLTLLMLSAAIWSIRIGRVRAHRRFMLGTYLGLVGAALPAALAPDRLLARILFG